MTNTTSRIRSVLVAIAIVVLASCTDDSSDQDNGEQAEPTSTTTTAEQDDTATTTTASEDETTTTTAPQPEGPDEWVAVVQDIYTRWTDLLTDPDPDQVSDIYAESCQCWETNFGTIEVLASFDEHIEGPASEVAFVQHENTDESGLVDLTVRLQPADLRRVDADGDVVQEIPADDDGQGCLALTVLQDGPGEAWRIYSEDPLTGCPESAD